MAVVPMEAFGVVIFLSTDLTYFFFRRWRLVSLSHSVSSADLPLLPRTQYKIIYYVYEGVDHDGNRDKSVSKMNTHPVKLTYTKRPILGQP